MRPLHCVLRWHPLHGLRIHIDDNVFGDHLGRSAAWRSGIARQAPIVRYIPERQQDRVNIPHRILLPILCRPVAVSLLRCEPLFKDLPRVDPAEKVFGSLLILGVTHQHVGGRKWQREPAAGALGQRRVKRILPQWRACLGQVRIGFLLGLEIDRSTIIGAADGARQVSAIVARIVPGEPALVVRILPKADCKLDRLDGFLAVQRHRLAVCLDLLAAPRPEIGIPEAWSIAEGVAKCLTKWSALALELFAGLAVLVPGLWEFAIAISNFREPGFAISQQPAPRCPGHADPLLADSRDRLRDLVIASLNRTDLRSYVADVRNTFGVELRPVPDHIKDVRARARLDRRSDARLDVVRVDHFEVQLEPERFFALRDDLALEQLIGGRYEIGPTQPVD